MHYDWKAFEETADASSEGVEVIYDFIGFWAGELLQSFRMAIYPEWDKLEPVRCRFNSSRKRSGAGSIW